MEGQRSGGQRLTAPQRGFCFAQKQRGTRPGVRLASLVYSQTVSREGRGRRIADSASSGGIHAHRNGLRPAEGRDPDEIGRG